MVPGARNMKYSHIINLVTKIVMLMRLFRESKGDILLHSRSYTVKLVVFIAAYLSNKTLHILESPVEIGEIIMDRKVGIILLEDANFKIDYVFKSTYCRNLDLIATISEYDLLFGGRDFNFIWAKALGESFWAKYHSLRSSTFKDERKLLSYGIRTSITESPLITMNHEGKRVSYSTSNVEHMLDAIDSEFGDSPRGIVSLGRTSFNQTFAYALYFFTRGDILDVLTGSVAFANILLTESKLKHKMFVSAEEFNGEWHGYTKFTFFNRINNFLRRWKMTKWLTAISYSRVFKYQMNTPNDEYIIINHQGPMASLEFLKRAHKKVSFIFGTFADGYTLAINRYDDKKLKIENGKFRVMGSNIKIEKNTINQLFIGGERVPLFLRNKYPVNVKDRSDLYHVTEYYCDIDEEVLTVRASSEDLYYEDEGNAIIDVGTKRRSLMEVPFLKRVDVFKHEGIFVCVVELDKNFIKKHFENPKLSDVIARIREKVDELNYSLSQYGKINRILVLDKFFVEYDSMSHVISKKNYIKLLNQKSFNFATMSQG